MLAAAAVIHPGRRPRDLKNRVKLLWQLARARPWLGRRMRQESHAHLRRHMEDDPESLGVVVWPYIHAGWTPEQRLAVQAEHASLVGEHLPWLALGQDDRRVLLGLEPLAPGLRLELDRGIWFRREGELVFNLFLGEHRMMSVPFSLAREQGEVVAYVGGIQGSNRPEALDVYRDLTKALHGLRPRDFAVKAFQLFAAAVGAGRLLCVADEFRHHRHAYFGQGARSGMHLDFDEVWKENGGERLATGFYQLPVVPAARPLEEAPARKRAMYRRRHQMVEELDLALRRELPPGLSGAGRPGDAGRWTGGGEAPPEPG